MVKMSSQDREEFNDYLDTLSDSQVFGVYAKEEKTRKPYAELAYNELLKRGLA